VGRRTLDPPPDAPPRLAPSDDGDCDPLQAQPDGWRVRPGTFADTVAPGVVVDRPRGGMAGLVSLAGGVQDGSLPEFDCDAPPVPPDVVVDPVPVPLVVELPVPLVELPVPLVVTPLEELVRELCVPVVVPLDGWDPDPLPVGALFTSE
jgi:hypothetical protein